MDDRLVEAFKGVLKVNLGVRAGERALVFTDLMPVGAVVGPVERSRREGLVRLASAAARAASDLGLVTTHHEYAELGGHGKEPTRETWALAFGEAAVRELEGAGVLAPIIEKRACAEDISKAREIARSRRDDAVGVVVALSNYSTSHTRFRDLLTSEAGARYASMPLFEEEMLDGAMDVDWSAVERRTEAVAKTLRGAESVRLTTPDGTDISFSVAGRPAMADTGMITAPGSFGNLPAGEAYLAPVEGTAEGVLILNWAPERKLASPVRVKVTGGLALEVSGSEPYMEELRAALAARPENRNIAELGVGTNDRAKRPDNILESEKIQGTVHIAFGDNTSMGGKVSAPFHQDFIFFGPTLVATGPGGVVTVLQDGRLLVDYQGIKADG